MSLNLNQIVTMEELEAEGVKNLGQRYADLEIWKNEASDTLFLLKPQEQGRYRIYLIGGPKK